MKKTLSIYLAGKIQKGHEKSDESYWTEADLDVLRKALPAFDLVFLNPAHRTDDLSDSFSIFGRDMLQVFLSDLVFVDARDRRGLGVGAEMMWAKSHAIPVLTLAPKNTHYHMSDALLLGVPIKNYIHPFVACLSDQVVGSLAEGAQWMQTFFQEKQPVKDFAMIRQSIQHYLDTQYPCDVPMQEVPASVFKKVAAIK